MLLSLRGEKRWASCGSLVCRATNCTLYTAPSWGNPCAASSTVIRWLQEIRDIILQSLVDNAIRYFSTLYFIAQSAPLSGKFAQGVTDCSYAGLITPKPRHLSPYLSNISNRYQHFCLLPPVHDSVERRK